MTISELYKKYYVSPNLKDHMFRVAGVASFIADHWTGSEIDWNTLIKCALIHDIGNLVKFNFERNLEFYGREKKNIKIWKERQKEMIAKYGSEDNEATHKILKEISFPENLNEIIYSKRFSNSIHTLESDNYLLKILHYSDLRVLPMGIDTLSERFAEAKSRQYGQTDNIEDLCQVCFDIEKQIQANVNVPLSNINSKSVQIDEKKFLDFEV